MEPWVWITLAAALVQTGRFMAQRQLAREALSATGATYARFVLGAPLAAIAALVVAGRAGGWPAMPPAFWAHAVAGGIAQILATVAVVRLFSLRNFAVGITLKKTEVLMTVAVSWAVLGEGVGAGALAAIALGFAGVVLLGEVPRGGASSAGIALGLGSGLAFAVAGVAYRGAALSLGSGSAVERAVIALAIVTALQLALMTAWLAWRDPAEIGRALRARRGTAIVGLTSVLGSFLWFAAFAMERAPLVYAVGQAEVIFTVAATTLVFRERITWREAAGIAVLTVAILGVVGLSGSG